MRKETATKWTVQANDLVGGWVVTNYPHPLSEHDMRKDGDPAQRGYVIAECMDWEDARTIAHLLNLHTDIRHWPDVGSGRAVEAAHERLADGRGAGYPPHSGSKGDGA